MMKISLSASEKFGKSRVLATEIAANLFWFSTNPVLVGFSTKVRVWVLPGNSARFVNSNSNFDRNKFFETSLMAKLNCLELSELVTLSMINLLLDQALLGTLNVSEKVPC